MAKRRKSWSGPPPPHLRHENLDYSHQAYRGYSIRTNALTGDMWIEKDGHLIHRVPKTESWSYARAQIDQLVGPVRNPRKKKVWTPAMRATFARKMAKYRKRGKNPARKRKTKHTPAHKTHWFKLGYKSKAVAPPQGLTAKQRDLWYRGHGAGSARGSMIDPYRTVQRNVRSSVKPSARRRPLRRNRSGVDPYPFHRAGAARMVKRIVLYAHKGHQYLYFNGSKLSAKKAGAKAFPTLAAARKVAVSLLTRFARELRGYQLHVGLV